MSNRESDVDWLGGAQTATYGSESALNAKRAWIRRLGVLALVPLLLVAAAVPVQATHNLNARKWDRQQSGIYNYAPRYYFNADVPSVCRSRFRDGAGTWNARNRELRYLEGAENQYTVYIEVKYQDLAWPNNGALAFSELDAFTDITWQKISFNNNVDISDGSRRFPYCGTSTPANDEYDFWSTAIHELGHNQIQNHTSASADVMYTTLIYGTTKRTLSTHDKDSFNALYAAAS